MYHKRETEEEKQEREEKEVEERENRHERQQDRNLTKILAAVVGGESSQKGQSGYLRNRARRPPGEQRPPLEKDHCTYCKKKEYWARDCPKKKQRGPKVSALEEDKGSRGSVPLPKPRVTHSVEGTPVNFLIDTGAEYSVLTEPLGQLGSKKILVMGATGSKLYPWTTKRILDIGKNKVTHSFLVIPECPAPLLGWDLWKKLKAQVQFTSDGPEVSWKKNPVACLVLNLEEQYHLHEQKSETLPFKEWLTAFPEVWAEQAGMELARQVPPNIVELKVAAKSVSVRQYPMSQGAKNSIRPHIQRLL